MQDYNFKSSFETSCKIPPNISKKYLKKNTCKKLKGVHVNHFGEAFEYYVGILYALVGNTQLIHQYPLFDQKSVDYCLYENNAPLELIEVKTGNSFSSSAQFKSALTLNLPFTYVLYNKRNTKIGEEIYNYFLKYDVDEFKIFDIYDISSSYLMVDTKTQELITNKKLFYKSKFNKKQFNKNLSSLLNHSINNNISNISDFKTITDLSIKTNTSEYKNILKEYAGTEI